MIFLLVFNPLLQLAASLNCPHGYTFQLPVPNSKFLPPVGLLFILNGLRVELSCLDGTQHALINIF